MQHLIVSRINLPWKPYASDPEWIAKRVALLNRNLRRSLLQQTRRDFKFITLWAPGTPREVMGFVPPCEVVAEVDGLDSASIAPVLSPFAGSGRVLISRVDSDDALPPDYVARLRDAADAVEGRGPYWLDVERMRYVGGEGRTKEERHPVTTQFCSMIEPVDAAGRIRADVFGSHVEIGRRFPGEVVPGLVGEMHIHGSNMGTKRPPQGWE